LHFFLRSSLDGGATWSVVTDTTQTISGLLVDQAGRLYATGGFLPTGYPTHLYVRMSADGGQTWTLLDDFQLAAGYETVGRGLMERDGSIYAVGLGTLSTSPYSTAWIVRGL
jgi:hypothetical protein